MATILVPMLQAIIWVSLEIFNHFGNGNLSQLPNCMGVSKNQEGPSYRLQLVGLLI